MLKTTFSQIRQSIRRWRALTLLKLPTEVIELIFAQADKKSLTSLCLTSKHTYAIASRVLHESFHCEGDRPDILETIPLLVRTLLDRPDLAPAVRVISIRTSKIQLKEPPEVWRLENHLAPIAAYNHIDATGVPFAGHWKADLAASNLDAWCALLLSLACNVQHIILHIPSSRCRSLTTSYLHAATCATGFYALRQVRSLDLGEWMGTRCRHALYSGSEEVLCGLKLPQMTSFACRISYRDNIADHVASGTMITTLELHCLDFTSLAQVLGSCPHLLSLSLSVSDREWLRQWPNIPPFDLTNLAAALQLSRHTLRCLHLDINVNAMLQQEHGYVVGALSLISLKHLTELTLSQRLLQAYRPGLAPNLDAILPSSLARLVLTDDHYEGAFDSKALSDGSVMEMLTTWLPSCMQRQPSLHFIRVVQRWRCVPLDFTRELRDFADGNGLHFERVIGKDRFSPKDVKILFPT